MSSKLDYWRRLTRLFIHYTRKATRLPYLPIRLWVELSSHCNYRCIMCPNKDLFPKDKGHMDFDLYTKIIDEAKDFARPNFKVNTRNGVDLLERSRQIIRTDDELVRAHRFAHRYSAWLSTPMDHTSTWRRLMNRISQSTNNATIGGSINAITKRRAPSILISGRTYQSSNPVMTVATMLRMKSAASP